MNSSRSFDGNAVLLRLESASKKEARLLQYTLLLWQLALVVIAFLILFKDLGSESANTPSKIASYLIVNIVIGSIVLFLLVVCFLFAFTRIYDANKQRKRWSTRRKLIATDAVVQLTFAGIMFTCWVAGYSITLAQPCDVSFYGLLFLSYVRWMAIAMIMLWMIMMLAGMSLRSSTRQSTLAKTFTDMDKLLISDAPIKEQLKTHIYPISAAILLAGIATASVIYQAVNGGHLSAYRECPIKTTCPSHTEDIITTTFQLLVMLTMIGFYWFYARRARNDLVMMPYAHYRLENVYVRVQVRFGAVVLASLFLSTALMEVGNFGVCTIYVSRLLGTFPVPLSLGLYALASATLFMPTALDNTFSQSILQMFAWTQDSYQETLNQRNAILKLEGKTMKARTAFVPKHLQKFIPKLGGDGPRILKRVVTLADQAVHFADLRKFVNEDPKQLQQEPMFCFELAIRLFYWARLAYQWNVEGTMQTEEYALKLFDLEHIECMHDEEIDTKMVMGRNSRDTLVIAFRGTASTKNAITDLKAWSKPYPGQHWRHGFSVRVHTGFYHAWSDNNYNTKVLEKVRKIIADSTGVAGFKVYITGHSLGGALATLCALAVKKENPAVQVTCITFGAPRTGNIGFASLCDSKFECWHVINEDDPIPRVPWFFYKRNGQQIVITSRGDMIVRPGFFELLLFKKTGKVADHMMGNYALAFASIIRAQFFPHKALQGGQRNAKALMKAVDVGATLLITPFDVEHLADPQSTVKMRAMVSKLDRDALLNALVNAGYKRPDDMKDIEEEDETEADAYVDAAEEIEEAVVMSRSNSVDGEDEEAGGRSVENAIKEIEEV